ncbi:NAD(P)/FAD-dependent oxidoreductase [Euzebya pacifica]|uniref:flavin-containing monooxygenase n=1 Tax=Euzebya pacifica TaxID=1608957 RepID=UPI0030F6992F
MTTSTSNDARLADEGYVETIVIGAGQAGLSMGYHLQRLGRPFVILDDRARVGDAWRQRWDSLRLFTPAKYDALDGMAFPAEPWHFPTKDEMADYLEAYAERFALPIHHGVRVERVSRTGDRFLVESGAGRWTADNVVVAMAGFQQPHIPGFAVDLNPSVVQLHSSAYREPGQLGEGDVLVVGAGNSGSDIAMDIVRHDQQVGPAGRRVLLAGRDTGQIPFHIESRFGRAIGMRFVLRFLFRRVLNVRTPIGRRARPKILSSGGPLIRLKAREIASAGIERVSRVEGVRDGMPVLADGERVEVSNVVWGTGFAHDFPWIDLPVHGELEPQHRSGVSDDHPGLYFLGLLFLDSMASEMIHGVGQDAARLAGHLDSRMSGQGTGLRAVSAA